MADRAKQTTKTKAGSGNKFLLTRTTATESELFRWASFPELNPYPILEVDSRGAVTYVNPSAAEKFPDIRISGTDHPMLQELPQVRVRLKDYKQKTVVREVSMGKSVYEQYIHHVPDTDRVRIYARDVTRRKQVVRDLSTLYEVITPVSVATELTQVLDDTVAKIMDVTGADAASIRLSNEDNSRLVLVSHRGFSEAYARETSEVAGKGKVGQYILKTGEVLISEELLNDSRFHRGLLAKSGFRSAAYVPLKTSRQVVGIMILASREPGRLSQSQEALFTAIAQHISVALENARLFEEVKKNTFELEEANQEIKKANLQLTRLLEEQHALREILSQINLVDMGELLKKVAEHALALLKVDHVQIRLLDKGGSLRRVAIAGKGAERLEGGVKLGSGRSTWVIENCKTLAIKDISQDKIFGPGHFLRELGVKGYLLIPLMSRGQKPIGVIGLSTLTERRFTPDEIALGEQLASGAAVAIENGKLYEESEKQQKIQNLLNEISRDITSFDTETLFKKLTERVRQFFDVDVCDVRMIENWQPVGVSGIEPERIRGSGTMSGRSRWIVENQRPLAIADIAQEAGGQIRSSARRVGLRGYLAVPLFSRGGAVIGIMRALTYKPREFTQAEVELLQQLANGAALCMENAKLFHETQLRAKEQAVLNATAMATSQSLDVKELLRNALDKVLEVMGRERGFIRFKEPVTGKLILAAHRGISESYARLLLHERTPGGKSDRVFKSGEPLVINDTEGTLLREETRNEGNSSIAWIPLKARGRVVGILNVSTSRPIPFAPREVELLQALGNVIGVALENARLFGETRRSLEQVRTLREIDQAMSSTLDLQIVLAVFLEKMTPLFPFPTVTTVHLLNKENWQLEPLACHNLDIEQWREEEAEPKEGLAWHVFNKGAPLVGNDLTRDPRVTEQSFCRRHRLASYLGVPLTFTGDRLGVIGLYTREAHRFTDEEVDLLSALASQAALAIQNSQLYEQTRLQAVELKKTNKGLQRREEVQKLLKELSQDITSLDIDSLLTKLTAKVREFFRIDISDVRVLEGGTWRQMGVSGIEPERLRGTGKPRPRADWVMQNRKPLMVPDMTKAADLSPGETTRRLGIRGYLAVPLFSKGGDVIGMLRALSYQPREFTQEEMDLLQQLANGAAVAVENARLFAETEQRATELAIFQTAASTFNQSQDLREMLNVVWDTVIKSINADAASLRVMNTQSDQVEFVADKGFPETYLAERRQIGDLGKVARRVLSTGEMIVSGDMEQDPDFKDGISARAGFKSTIYAPIRAKDRVLGILHMVSRTPHRFCDRERDILVAIGQQIGAALENVRLFQETERRAQAQEALNALATATSQSLDLKALLQTALDKVLEVTGRERGYIRLKDPVTHEITLAAHRGIAEEYIEVLTNRRTPVGRTGRVFTSGEPLVVNDLQETLLKDETWREGDHSIAWIPLKAKGAVVGILNVSTTRPFPFDRREIELLQAIGNVIGMGLENARLFEETQRSLKSVRVLREIDQAITSTLHLETVLNVLLEKIDLFHPYFAATIRLFNAETGLLEPVACRNLDEKEWKEHKWQGGRGLANAVFETKAPIIVRDARTDPRVRDREFYRKHRLVSYLGVPLIAKDQVLGVLNFYTKKQQEISNKEVDFLSTIAGQAAIAIYHSQLYEQVKASKDRLELLNQRMDRSLREISGLYTVLTPLAPAESVQEVLEGVIEKLMESTGAEAALIRLFDKIEGRWALAAQRGYPDFYLERTKVLKVNSAADRVLKTGEAVIASEIAADSRLKGKVQYEAGMRSCAILPLKVRGEVRGMMQVSSRRLGYFNEESKDHLVAIARQMGIMLENREFFDELREAKDELETANKVKDEFLSVMSHELRTPLNVVVGYTEMMRDHMLGEVNTEQQRALGKVIRRSKELLDMIDSVLQATSIEAKTVKVENGEVSLDAFLGDLKLFCDIPLAEETTMVWDVPSDLPSVKTDAEKLKRILKSLIHNAIKFTPKGRIAISARYVPSAKTVEFKVTDTGIGIPQELQPLIFEMFRQGESSETRLYGGVGLGLYIARRLTEMLGGTITVKSKPDEGSCFTVAIPCEKHDGV